MARVTNLAKSPRGFATVAGRTAMLAPGQTADMDVPDSHPVHDAWVRAGHVSIIHDQPAPPAAPSMEPPAPEDKPNERKRRNTAHVG